jgi:hypothetical protein
MTTGASKSTQLFNDVRSSFRRTREQCRTDVICSTSPIAVERIRTQRVNERLQQSSRACNCSVMSWGNAEFLKALRSPERAIANVRHLAVVTAHPDDETIGCGA